jgi:hypothetical protein
MSKSRSHVEGSVSARKIETLITELMALQLRTAQIHVRETEIVAEIATLNLEMVAEEAMETGEALPMVPAREIPARKTLAVGDRVFIKTVVKPPANWPKTVQWDKDRAQFARVVRVAPTQINLVTDNNTETWRLPYNVARILDQAE